MDKLTAQPHNVSFSTPTHGVPLIAVEGSAFDCGREYVEIVLSRYPGYHRYLNMLDAWRRLPRHVEALFDQRAPYIPEVYRGMLAAYSPATGVYAPQAEQPATEEECTSFGLGGTFTADGLPLSGQNKDTVRHSESLYIVLRMRITGAPTILVLAYPGEVLGYGLWSTGMTLFRNSLHSTADHPVGLTKEQFGLLALAGRTVDEATELAMREGVQDQCNILLSDSLGGSINVETNGGGVDVLPAANGLCVHANHPVGTKTIHHEQRENQDKARNSRLREQRLTNLLREARGKLTSKECFRILSDHENYPYGLCSHDENDSGETCTTASVVAEPARGLLHVVRSNPCRSRPVSYSI